MADQNIDPAAAQPPLPLFRPEVLASQQHKFYGDVLSIRPFSGSFFLWLGILLAGFIVGILLLGRYTEKSSSVSRQQPSGASTDARTR